jgi:hypothetical protein
MLRHWIHNLLVVTPANGFVLRTSLLAALVDWTCSSICCNMAMASPSMAPLFPNL